MTENLNLQFSPVIQAALEAAAMEAPERRVDRYLWISDIGKNPYSAIKRLITGELDPFDYATRQKMENGTALEIHNLARIQGQMSAKTWTQVPVFNRMWSGYADLVISAKPAPIIYDHKASGGRWWDYKDSLPRAGDCCQVWLYGQIMDEESGIQGLPRDTRLYYHGWGGWAEFRIAFGMIPREPDTFNQATHEPGLICYGWITGDKGGEPKQVTRYRRVNPVHLRRELGYYYSLVLNDGCTLADLEAHYDLRNPGGPDWDYAEDNYDRLAALYGEDGLILPDGIPPAEAASE